jgi:4a-hydroxytetrahydrobiopterin dehydratase
MIATKCEPCREGDTPLDTETIRLYLDEIKNGWELGENPSKIEKSFEFKDFSEAVEFINKVAVVAETEGHHPNLCLYNYKFVKVELWTHKIGGLHENDFVLAVKINAI